MYIVYDYLEESITIYQEYTMRFSEEKTFKFGFYCLNALICIYSLYMFVIQNGASNESEILFYSTFVVDAIMYYLKRKN